ncbi:MAG: FG-GAP-like repeat-containing protein [Lacunisphaera sp.]|nr:FG-GAP-like repeat-containing protein [Lacunisphaera sp.]
MEYNLGKNPGTYDQGTSTLGGAVPAGWTTIAAADLSIPTTLAVGSTAGTLSVDKSGAANYSVPLWVSPGVAGIQPQLSLNYSSQAGNGMAGFGWSLGGVSAINRGPTTLTVDGYIDGVDFDGNDQFYLDGQRLILVNGVHGQNGAEYRTELESFTKVVAYGGSGGNPAYFKAWTKAGLIIEFGNGNESAFQASAWIAPISWHVSKISDTSGNYMTFIYEQNTTTGEHRLVRIDYPGGNSVGLDYEDRPDVGSGFAVGAPIASLKRLWRIRSMHGATAARTYTLAYTSTPFTSRSMLTSLTEAGAYGQSYAPLVFDYEDNNEGWDENSDFVPEYYLADNSNSGRPAGSGFIDLNGDGRTDFVVRRDGTGGFSGAYLNTGSSWSADSNYLLPYPMANTANDYDQGGRFADVNSDGLVDYIYRKYAYGGAESNEAWLNPGTAGNPGTGWMQSTTWRAPALVYQDGSIDDYPRRGAKFLDLNGDGRVDFVGHLTGPSGLVNLAVYLNNGNGWNALNSNYSSPPGLPSWVVNSFAKYKPRFIDLNGDGLPDLTVNYVYGSDILQKTWLNNGNGWTESAAYLLPQPIADNVNASLGAEFVDANGDGLPDLLWYRETAGTSQRGVALNTGTGWNVPASGTDLFDRYAPPHPLARDGFSNAGSTFSDLNADGMPDYVYSRQFTGLSIERSVDYGTSHNWAYAGLNADHELPYLLLQPGITQTGADFVDLDGDGVVDAVWRRKHASGSPVEFASAQINRANPINGRLKKVTNGLGVEASIAYKPLTDSSVYTKGSGGPADSVNLIGPMYVVSTLTHDDGAGGTYPVKYTYAGLRSDRLRGSLGFASMTVTDDRKTVTVDRENIVSTTTFKQAYPYIGMPENRSTTCGSVTLKEQAITYDTKPYNNNQTRFVFARTTTEITRDLNGALLSTVTTSIPEPDPLDPDTIDEFGNIEKLIVDSGNGFTKTTKSEYTNDETNWFLGRLTSSSVTSTAPGADDITRKSGFTYWPATGLLKEEIVEPDDTTLQLKLTTTYSYDAHGNKETVAVSGAIVTVTNTAGDLSASGTVTRTTTIHYDAEGRFPEYTENAVEHREYYTYDPNLGTLGSITGPNNFTTSWQIDSFGRKIQETRADGTTTDIRYKWASSAAPTGAKYLIETESYVGANPVSVPTLSFYDKFGRAFSTPSINGDGFLVWQETEFDRYGRTSRTSNPHFTGYPVYWSGTSSFDDLDRPTTIYAPDDAVPGGLVFTNINYDGLTVKTTDPKDRVTKTVKNSQGWTMEIIRNYGIDDTALDYSRVGYTYDALGNLTQTDAAEVITTLTYDLRGRKVSMTDADMGTWRYRYNIFGELIWQRDAKILTPQVSCLSDIMVLMAEVMP